MTKAQEYLYKLSKQNPRRRCRVCNRELPPSHKSGWCDECQRPKTIGDLKGES